MSVNHDELLAAVEARGKKRAAFAVRPIELFTEEATMAKAKEQQTIDGAADQVSRRVRDTAKKYAVTLNHWMALKDDLEVLRMALMEKMLEDDVECLEVSVTTYDDKAVRYEVKRDTPEATPKIKCKKLGEDE